MTFHLIDRATRIVFTKTWNTLQPPTKFRSLTDTQRKHIIHTEFKVIDQYLFFFLLFISYASVSYVTIKLWNENKWNEIFFAWLIVDFWNGQTLWLLSSAVAFYAAECFNIETHTHTFSNRTIIFLFNPFSKPPPTFFFFSFLYSRVAHILKRKEFR